MALLVAAPWQLAEGPPLRLSPGLALTSHRFALGSLQPVPLP